MLRLQARTAMPDSGLFFTGCQSDFYSHCLWLLSVQNPSCPKLPRPAHGSHVLLQTLRLASYPAIIYFPLSTTLVLGLPVALQRPRSDLWAFVLCWSLYQECSRMSWLLTKNWEGLQSYLRRQKPPILHLIPWHPDFCPQFVSQTPPPPHRIPRVGRSQPT